MSQKVRRKSSDQTTDDIHSGRAPSDNSGPPTSLSTPYTPSPAELDGARRFTERRKATPPPPRAKIKHDPPGPVQLEGDHPEQALWEVAFHRAFGTTDSSFANWLLNQLMNANHEGGKSQPIGENALNGALAAIHGIAPRDETEAMLAAQMVAAHQASMVMMRRLNSVETIPQQDSAGSLAIKFLRTYAAQVEALSRYRGKGKQTVRVEHVTVEAGGQAIVGSVSTGRGEGGGEKSEEQPHAKQITHAPQPSLQCEDPKRNPMPVPRGSRQG